MSSTFSTPSGETPRQVGAMLPLRSRIFLAAHSQYRGIYLGVAHRLRRDLDAEIHLYTPTKEVSEYYNSRFGPLFASISVANSLYETALHPVADASEVFDRAARYEAELGMTINELSVSDRHLGRGFALGGFRHPRSHMSEYVDQAQMVHAYNAEIAFWQRELEANRPAVILNAGKVLCVLARQRGIPVRLLAGSRYRNYYYWAVNEFHENPMLEPAFHSLASEPAATLEAPYDAHLRFRAHFRKSASTWRTMRQIGYHVLEQGYWRLRRYDKARGYLLRENVAYLWRRRREIRRFSSRGMLDLAALNEVAFAFFPLATEPETALQTLSPEYFYQLPAIASVARDLPAGAILAVKEHYAAVGRRPRDFYGQIAEFKNVRMLNMAELGIEAVRAAKAVVTITGTGGFEGAVLGKPVITFGRHNTYNFLPHVMVVREETQLKGFLRRAFSKDFDAERAARDGGRFLQAVIATSFDLGDFAPTEPEKAKDAAVDAAYAGLAVSLAGTTEPQFRASAAKTLQPSA